MKVSVPPRFGVCANAGSAPRARRVTAIAQNRAALAIAFLLAPRLGVASAVLFVEPDRRQILINIKARADLPPLKVGAVRHDAVLPQHEYLVRLFVEHAFLEGAHRRTLLRWIGL